MKLGDINTILMTETVSVKLLQEYLKYYRDVRNDIRECKVCEPHCNIRKLPHMFSVSTGELQEYYTGLQMIKSVNQCSDVFHVSLLADLRTAFIFDVVQLNIIRPLSKKVLQASSSNVQLNQMFLRSGTENNRHKRH